MPYKNSNIKNIIFDLGGVILNIDYALTFNAFKKLGFSNFDELFAQAKQVGVFDQFDKGLITPVEFINTIRSLSSKPLSDNQILTAWNALLLDFPISRLKLLEQIRNHYRTFLLSNTNQIHCEVYNSDLFRTFGVKDLSYFFEKVYYSHVIHMRKPDREVYELLINENGLKPDETLFIDDTEQHVEGAKLVGIHTYLLKVKDGETIESLFKNS